MFVNELTVEDTISILRGIKEKCEVHHGVRITDGAIVAAATLSLDELDRRIIQLKIEREALQKETDPASRERQELRD